MEFFEVKRASVQIVLPDNYFQAKIKIQVKGATDLRVCEDSSLFEALNLAMYQILVRFFPGIKKIELEKTNGFLIREAKHVNKMLIFLKARYEELISENAAKVA